MSKAFKNNENYFIVLSRGDNMLYTDLFVNRGVIFMKIDGEINDITIEQFDNTINYLLYNIGIKYFVMDFIAVKMNKGIIPIINNKLLEIYTSCEKVVIRGIDNKLLDLSFIEKGCY